jgi:hypothetical protein
MTEEKQLVAYCGLYCGSCGAYQRGKCEACKPGGGFSACKIRICCEEKNYETCAECNYFETCTILNSFTSRIFGVIFRKDRKGNLCRIKEIGVEKWVKEMEAT